VRILKRARIKQALLEVQNFVIAGLGAAIKAFESKRLKYHSRELYKRTISIFFVHYPRLM